MGRMHDIACDINAGLNNDQISDKYDLRKTTVRIYRSKVRNGFDPPAQAHIRPPGRRSLAMAQFRAGRSLDEVCADLGLKRATAMCYRWEAGVVPPREANRCERCSCLPVNCKCPLDPAQPDPLLL